MNTAPPPITTVYRPVASLRPNPRNARTHSKRQIRELAKIIKAAGFLNPIVIDEFGMVLAGHGLLAAAGHLGMDTVPTLCAAGLSEAVKRAYILADNKIAEKAGWDRERLAQELTDLTSLLPPLDWDVTLTGFDPGEIDQIFADRIDPAADPADDIPPLPTMSITRLGDLWRLGPHRLLCGDARAPEAVDRLMGTERAHMIFTDPPYNVRVHGHVQGRGQIRHREFAHASGEMDTATFRAFLQTTLGNAARMAMDGAIAFVFMDWRHMADLHDAGLAVFAELKNLVVWNKTTPGQGLFYRSQHELIFVFKVGDADHINTFGLGARGRTRSNVWTYPGANSFRVGRMEELAMHPTVKPIALVADAMRDCSMKGDLVLDVFMGSGTTLLAAEKVGRRAYGVECDPGYIDVCIRRWEAYTRQQAVLDNDGRTFDEIAAERAAIPETGHRLPAEMASSGAPAAGSTEPATHEYGDWAALCEPWPPAELVRGDAP